MSPHVLYKMHCTHKIIWNDSLKTKTNGKDLPDMNEKQIMSIFNEEYS